MKKKLLSKLRIVLALPKWLKIIVIVAVSLLGVLFQLGIIGEEWTALIEFLESLVGE